MSSLWIRSDVRKFLGRIRTGSVKLLFLVNQQWIANKYILVIIRKQYGRDSFRKAREAHLIHEAKTIEPLGINRGINKRDQPET